MTLASITVVSGNLLARLKAAGRKVAPLVRKELTKAGQRSEREIIRGSFRGYTGTSGSKLQTRSGTLRKSINYKVTGSHLGNLQVKIGASAPYARAHEYGRPPVYSKRGKKYYTIPTKHALTPAGVLRKPITEYRSHTKLRRSKKSGGFTGSTKSYGFIEIENRLLFVEHKRKGKFIVLFNLYRFPTKPIPARLGLRKAVDRQKNRLLAGLVNAVREVLSR